MVHRGKEHKTAEMVRKTNEVLKQQALKQCNRTSRQEKVRKYDRVFNLKKELMQYYEAPKPKQKQAFIRQMGVQKINMFHLAGMQIKYISKWVWVISLLFCVLIYGIVYQMQGRMNEQYIHMIVAFFPFLVMLSLTESMRSYRYGMEELELSSRFSLKSIVMARLLILGTENLAILIFVSVLLRDKIGFSILYILTPYFVTTGGGLCIVRNIRGSENTFFCFLLALGAGMMQIILSWQFEALFLPGYLPLWMLVCVAGMITTVKEGYQTIQMTEELAWN